MKVPITVTEILQKEDGTAEIKIEFDDDIKKILMKAWGVSVWDNERAQREFQSAISQQLNQGSDYENSSKEA